MVETLVLMEKIKLVIITVMFPITAWAADLVITVPDQDIPRVQEAFGSILGLGRNATPAEVSKACQDYLHQSTLDYERRKNTYLYTPPPMHFPTPTPGGLAAPQAAAAPSPVPKATATPTPKPKKK
jgi:hypothetical protein